MKKLRQVTAGLLGIAALAATMAASAAVSVAVVSEGPRVTTLRITVGVPALEPIDTKAGKFERFSQREKSQGGLDAENQGFPELPIIGFPLALPVDLQTAPGVTVTPEGQLQRQPARLYPIQPMETANRNAPDRPPFEFDPDIYLKGVRSPGQHLDRNALFKGDANIESFRFSPYGYDPREQILTWYSSYLVTIQHAAGSCFRIDPLEDPKGAAVFDDIDRKIEQYPLPMLKYALNQAALAKVCAPGTFPPALASPRFIIVTHPNFEAAANALKTHKQSLGISTLVVTTTTITGGSANATAQQIRDWIANYWNTHTIHPKWVMLMGDAEFIPTHYDLVNRWDPARNASDIWYGQFDPAATATTVPPFGIGRLPVDTLSQATTIVNKIIAFENSPPVDSKIGPDFYSRLTFASYFEGSGTTDDRWFAETSEIVRNHVLAKGFSAERIYAASSLATPTNWRGGDPVPAELRKPTFPWLGNKTDITNALNNGTVLFYHRDHGWWDGLGHPEFLTPDLASVSITNNQFPVVFSINCASGLFDNETVDLPANRVGSGYGPSVTTTWWSEAFLRKADGALAIIGDTRQSSTIANNHLTIGLFDAIYPGLAPDFGTSAPVRRLGDVLNHARAFIAAVDSGATTNLHPKDTGGAVPGVDGLRQELNLYNLLGDPTVSLRTHSAWSFDGLSIVAAYPNIFVTVKPVCLRCPPGVPAPEMPVAVAIDPATGGVLGRALINSDGQASIDVGSFKGLFWVRVGADDGAIQQAASTETDTDGDGVADSRDNCIRISNATQLDSDGDGYGNHCDADFNNDGIVNSIDLAQFRQAFGRRDRPNFDLNGDGIVNAIDLALFRAKFATRPGPSAWHLGGT